MISIAIARLVERDAVMHRVLERVARTRRSSRPGK
jgi:hypothetical protein